MTANATSFKDKWDKLTTTSGLLTVVSSLIVAAAGWYFTNTYRETEQRVAELAASEKMIAHLAEGERETEAPLAQMSSLSRPEVAAAMARLYGGKGAIAAMERLATNAPTAGEREAARDALRALTSQSNPGEAKAVAAALSAAAAQSALSGPAEQIVVVNSGAKASGEGKGWSEWYQLCGVVPPGYTLASGEFRLVGDRSCGAWAECEETQKTNDQVCYRFRMQGHDERFAPRVASSEGILRIIAKR
jgi:hypothetical protein